MTAPTCPTCAGSGEVPVNPEAAWSGLVQVLTFRPCGECGGAREARDQECETERAIIKSFGIDASGSEPCLDCEMSHKPWLRCPPVLPLGSATWEGLR